VKAQVYIDSRPAEYFTKYHERVRTRRPDWVYRMARLLLTFPVLIASRYRAIDLDNVPERGGVILAPNHFSFMDHFLVAVLLRREIQFMAKSQLFRPPFLDFILTHGGAFPVQRGQRDDEAFISAHSILSRGGMVLMYAEGGRSRSGELGKPKPGLGRLAVESGVPVVPVAIHGSEGFREFKRLRIPKVTVQFGEPVTFDVIEHPSREQSQQAAEAIFERVGELHTALRSEGRRGVLARRRRRRRQGAPVTG
jgi:1-acyl-sn-glycerol-3-phosphate acyltransferase